MLCLSHSYELLLRRDRNRLSESQPQGSGVTEAYPYSKAFSVSEAYQVSEAYPVSEADPFSEAYPFSKGGGPVPEIPGKR